MNFIARRLTRGDDLRRALASLMSESKFKAACLLSIVGSLTHAKLRAAGAKSVLSLEGPLEIVSGTGTFAPDAMHIHIAVSDVSGTTFGGHLLEGCLIASTAEIVLAEVAGWSFTRIADSETGYPELLCEELT